MSIKNDKSLQAVAKEQDCMDAFSEELSQLAVRPVWALRMTGASRQIRCDLREVTGPGVNNLGGVIGTGCGSHMYEATERAIASVDDTKRTSANPNAILRLMEKNSAAKDAEIERLQRELEEARKPKKS